MQLPFRLFQGQAVSLPEQQFLALKKQGSGIVGVAHFLAFVMIVATSVASLITLAGVVVNRVVASLAHGHTQFTDVANIVISVFFVLVMDTGAVYGATQIRIILERSLNKRALWLHVPLVIVVSIIEGLTYGVMLWTYDPPQTALQGFLIVARASSVPLLSLYLVLARVTPAGTSDIINLANMSSGLGLLDDVYASSQDKSISMARKAEIFQATAGNGSAEAKLKQLMTVLQTPVGMTAGTDITQFVTHAHLDQFAEDIGNAHRTAIEQAVQGVEQRLQTALAEMMQGMQRQVRTIAQAIMSDVPAERVMVPTDGTEPGRRRFDEDRQDQIDQWLGIGGN